ncbi:winged helix-turn-helix domain-containing protein [Paraburkholderia ginsengiterrae]|uniref:OmpR/PhoB-type domain-containing protein n=1 Tax=Paraburkholderia ginsengiterrae TaxID=1462993 RepID=A0A1A9N5C6_9BURK|nr:winged helix-turn-helix domain-containing protein [Paraburkholderia ginsengiterrae]OAJ56811.1 hypothetical protein A6V37_30855 [Paraburkholderia ginsengiterrae]
MKVGRFYLDVETRRLMLEREDMQLGSRAFDILLLIVAAGGRLVTRDELLDVVWKGVIVADSNLDVHLCSIRKKLGSDRNLIVTVPRRGYRFAGVKSGAEPFGAVQDDRQVPTEAWTPSVRREEAMTLLGEILSAPALRSRNRKGSPRSQLVSPKRIRAWHLRMAIMRNSLVPVRAARIVSAAPSAAGALRCARANPMRRRRQL